MSQKLNIAFLLILSFAQIAYVKAQSPDKINYQAVARNTETGEEISNQPLFVVVKIVTNGPNGTIVYQENHPNVQTNMFGLFSIAIGGGEAVSGTFANINWQDGSFWLQIDIDAGSGMETLGTMQFISVPYALHAETVTNADDADADPQNELVNDLIFNPESNSLSLIQPGSTLTQDLSELLNDADADPENELVNDLIFNPETNSLSLIQPGSTLTQDLSELIDDADADTTNELVSDFVFDNTTNTLSLTQANGTLSQDLTSLGNDADADPENELITSFELNGTTVTINEAEPWSLSLAQLVDDADADPANEVITNLALLGDTLLRVTEAGSLHDLNLAPLKGDADWKISNDGSVISNFGDKVGVGTSTPKSNFEVQGSIGYKTKILENGLGAMTYNVSGTDHIIICKMSPPNVATITINMPEAASYKGREIIVRKTGTGPIYPDVNINFGSDQLDFINDNIQLTETKETVTLISLGSDGWTRIYKN